MSLETNDYSVELEQIGIALQGRVDLLTKKAEEQPQGLVALTDGVIKRLHLPIPTSEQRTQSALSEAQRRMDLLRGIHELNIFEFGDNTWRAKIVFPTFSRENPSRREHIYLTYKRDQHPVRARSGLYYPYSYSSKNHTRRVFAGFDETYGIVKEYGWVIDEARALRQAYIHAKTAPNI